MQEIREGEPELIYVTPERLENQDYLELLNRQRHRVLRNRAMDR